MNILDELGDAIARAGWSETSRRSGIDRPNLHRAFGRNRRRQPTLATVERVAAHLGFRLALEPIEP